MKALAELDPEPLETGTVPDLKHVWITQIVR